VPDTWDDHRPKQRAEVKTKLQCCRQQISSQDCFFQLWPFQNLVECYSPHMVNVTVQVFSMNKNQHLLSLVRMREYSRMRTSVRMAETALHTCRGNKASLRTSETPKETTSST